MTNSVPEGTDNQDREALAEAIRLSVMHPGRSWIQHADAVLAAGFCRPSRDAAVVEWGVEYGANGVDPDPRGEDSARRWLGMTRYPGARLMRRQRVAFADAVTEWTPAERPGGAA